MFYIGICDDGEAFCDVMATMLRHHARENGIEIEIERWYSGESLRDDLADGCRLDVLFLDIELFELSGIEVGAYIRNRLDNRQVQIVYISGKAAYAQQLFKTQPLDFLVKPISQEQISEVMDMALRLIKRQNKRLEFQHGQERFFIPMGDIFYLKSEGRKIKVITEKAAYEFYGRLREVAKQLSEDFIMIHQSYMVNRVHVFRYSYEAVELEDGTVLAISQSKRKAVRELLLRERL